MKSKNIKLVFFESHARVASSLCEYCSRRLKSESHVMFCVFDLKLMQLYF